MADQFRHHITPAREDDPWSKFMAHHNEELLMMPGDSMTCVNTLLRSFNGHLETQDHLVWYVEFATQEDMMRWLMTFG